MRGRQQVAAETSCALDLAARGGMTLEEVATVFGVTRERIRQIEVRALKKLRDVARVQDLCALFELVVERRPSVRGTASLLTPHIPAPSR